MKMFNKILAGTAAAAALTVTAAAPAQAQYYDRYYQRDRGIDVGDIAAGVAIIGGIAAITSALTRDQGYYGYGYGYGYGNRYQSDYRFAVNSCGSQAQRYGRASVTDVQRVGANRYRVSGVVDGYDRRGFACTARANGRVTNFQVARGYW